jgi:ABC-type protease/lipase transport system fused ATPase/permease subunit
MRSHKHSQSLCLRIYLTLYLFSINVLIYFDVSLSPLFLFLFYDLSPIYVLAILSVFIPD